MDELEELLLAAHAKGKKDTRTASGIKAVELCASRALDNKLSELAADKKLPKKVRKYAAKKIIDKCIAKGWYRDLIEISENKKLPRASRRAAKKGVNAAALNEICELGEKRSYISLLRIIMNKKLAGRIRKIAKAIADDILHGREVVLPKPRHSSYRDEVVDPSQKFLHGLQKNNRPTARERIKRLFFFAR